MSNTYFNWLSQQTASRVWINNPTAAEIELGPGAGRGGLHDQPRLRRQPAGPSSRRDSAHIVEVVAAGARGDEAVALVQGRLVGRILPHFTAIHEQSCGREGWVSMQGAPELDTSVEPILASARAARSLAANCIPKVPATAPGLAALDVLVRDDQPVLMTEVFSLAQVEETCERYLRASAESGHTPVLIMAPITGILAIT